MKGKIIFRDGHKELVLPNTGGLTIYYNDYGEAVISRLPSNVSVNMLRKFGEVEVTVDFVAAVSKIAISFPEVVGDKLEMPQR